MSTFQIICWALLGIGLVAFFMSLAALIILIVKSQRDPPEDWS